MKYLCMKFFLTNFICYLFLLTTGIALAENNWQGSFAGRTVLETGVSLPNGLDLHNKKIEFNCEVLDFQFPNVVGHCTSEIELSIRCGSVGIVAMTSSPWINEGLIIEPLDTIRNYIQAEYSATNDTWTGEYHFFPNQFCNGTDNPYTAVDEFFVSFILKRNWSGQSLTPIYQLLLD